MAKDVISECTMPAPIAPPATGNAAADEALTRLAVWELSAYDPNIRPYSDDYKKACKVAAKVGYQKLLPLLDDPNLFEVGASVWDEARNAKLSPAKKKEYTKVRDQTAHARKARVAYILFLVEAVIPEGYKRLLEIARDPDISPDIRARVIGYLEVNFDDKKRLLEIAKCFDLAKWTGERDGTERLDELAIGCIEAWNKADPRGCFDALKGYVTPAAAAKSHDRADAIVTMLYRSKGEGIDPRWAVAIAPLVGGRLDVITAMALEGMPKDPAIIPPILEALGDFEKQSHFYEGFIKVVARAATMEAVPLLRKIIAEYPKHADMVLDLIEDKAVKQAVQAAVAEDAPAAEAKANKAAVRKRAQLTFKKVKALKRPKLGTFAAQEAEWKAMFEKAGIPKAFSIAQRAVALHPTRVDESKMKVGITKLGGHPDLPAKVEWPRVAKAPLTFVAQLRFEDFAPLLGKAVPKGGTLAIFVDDDAQAGNDYLQNARAIYSKPGTKLERREVPDDFVATIYQACTVELFPKLSLPSPSNAHVTKALDEETVEIYSDQVFVHDESYNQVLGYRDHGYDAEEPATAQHLLQLIGDSQTDMEFGDADYLAFFIDAKKLAKGDFSKVWPHCGD